MGFLLSGTHCIINQTWVSKLFLRSVYVCLMRVFCFTFNFDHQVFKEEEESIRVDLHEGCGRSKLFWVMTLADSKTLKAMVEFKETTPGIYSLIIFIAQQWPLKFIRRLLNFYISFSSFTLTYSWHDIERDLNILIINFAKNSKLLRFLQWGNM